MVWSYSMMLLMTICEVEDLALVADDTCEGYWSESF